MNKKVTVFLFTLAAMAGLSSCADDGGLHQQSAGVRLTLVAHAEKDASLKASLDESYSFVWEDEDQLGLYIDNASTPTVNVAGTASVSGEDVTYSAIVNDYTAGDRLYAYFPYDASADRNGKVKLSISVAQSQTAAGVLDGKNFPMIAVPYTFVSDASAAEEPSLYFKHLAAFVELDVYAAENAYVGEKVLSVEFITTDDVAGAFQFDYKDVPEEPSFSFAAGQSSSVTVTLDEPATVTASKGINKIYMAIKPGKYQARVKVTTDSGVYLFPVDDEIGTFDRAYVRRFSLGLKASSQIYRSTLTSYTGKIIKTQKNTTKMVYFDLETASNYAASAATSAEDRKKTDLVLYYSSTNGTCLGAPALSDLKTFADAGVIDCYNWSAEEKNKTKIKLLADMTDEEYQALNVDKIETLTSGMEDGTSHRVTGVSAGSYYGFKTVQMDADGNVKEVVSAGVMKITLVNNITTTEGLVKFDYKICSSYSAIDTPAAVTVSEGKILVDGSEYVIKGVAANNFHGKAASIGANTLRVYSMDSNTMDALSYILDQAYVNGLKVCVGLTMFPWNQGGITDYYNEKYTGTVAKLRTHLETVVGAYKNHPAVLMWCIGNECDSAYDGTENLSNEHHMWNVIEEFAGIIQEMDTNHPVTTCLANAANVSYINTYCPSLDLLMVNSYGDAIQGLSTSLVSWTKPFVVGEFAHQGTWAVADDMKLSWNTTSGKPALIELTSTQKAEAYATAWNDVVTSGAAGGFAFQWGYQTHGEVLTWFGMYDRYGNSFGAADELKYMWTGSYPSLRAPLIADRSKMLMNGQTADDGVIVSVNQSCTASVTASSPSGLALSYEWIIVEENTYAEDGGLPEGIEGLISDPYASSVSFNAPATSGAYRLYVFVRAASAGKVASACIPFNVTE